MFAIMMMEESSAESGAGIYVWVALIIFFLMVFLGWLASSKGWLKKEEELTQSSHDLGGHDVEEDLGHDHQQSAQEREINLQVNDNLTIIEGIGPKVEKVLANIGITTFSGLAGADHSMVRGALDEAGYKYMDPTSWFEQADLAAKGDMGELKRLQDSLKGGRKVN